MAAACNSLQDLNGFVAMLNRIWVCMSTAALLSGCGLQRARSGVADLGRARFADYQYATLCVQRLSSAILRTLCPYLSRDVQVVVK